MREYFIKFIAEDVNGCGTVVLARVYGYGNTITDETIHRVKNAIRCYKYKNEGKWDTDGCLQAAKEYLEFEGFEVHWINGDFEICF